MLIKKTRKKNSRCDRIGIGFSTLQNIKFDPRVKNNFFRLFVTRLIEK